MTVSQMMLAICTFAVSLSGVVDCKACAEVGCGDAECDVRCGDIDCDGQYGDWGCDDGRRDAVCAGFDDVRCNVHV